MKQIFIVILSLLTLVSCKNEEATQRLYQDLQASYEKGSALLSEQSSKTRQEMAYWLSDEAKAKYLPGLPVAKSIEEGFASVSQLLLEKPSNRAEIENAINDLLTSYKKDYNDFLMKYGERFGLKTNEIVILVNRNIQKIDDFSFTHSTSPIDEKILLEKVKFDLKILEFQLIEELNFLVGGPPIACYFGIHPEVIPNQNFVKRGQPFSGTIGLQPIGFDFLASDVELKVDGVNVPFDKGRFATYVSEPIHTENKTIIISAKIIDKRTGRLIKAWSDYEYLIETIQ